MTLGVEVSEGRQSVYSGSTVPTSYKSPGIDATHELIFSMKHATKRKSYTIQVLKMFHRGDEMMGVYSICTNIHILPNTPLERDLPRTIRGEHRKLFVKALDQQPTKPAFKGYKIHQ
ncbi:hypothetical protein CVT26_011709 [Gymnopilus dilepis]|uniref:Uncharacterized protein n=1 Tax=Gymnopilus dilepis TaxID=231916 RepID=A0A409YH78_9AGAR|nr:hypothetical protein CVT26_011709 [Gymnopilus dilepis]